MATVADYTADQSTPDVETVLAERAPHVGPVSGSWSCPSPCNAMSANGHINDGSLTTREEREAQHRAHLAAVLEPLIREREAKALEDAATDLPEQTEGPLRIGTALWPECDRDAYSLAIEEAQSALRGRAATHRQAQP